MANLNALVLEDNPHMRLLLTEVLRGIGVENVAAVASVTEAKTELREKPFHFALVDVGLEEENGLDFIQDLRRDRYNRHRYMPTIVVSGQGQRNVIEAARDCGADGFLIKPVSLGTLGAKVRQVLAQPSRYIESADFVGPDRRRRQDPNYRGAERRGRGKALDLD